MFKFFWVAEAHNDKHCVINTVIGSLSNLSLHNTFKNIIGEVENVLVLLTISNISKTISEILFQSERYLHAGKWHIKFEQSNFCTILQIGWYQMHPKF